MHHDTCSHTDPGTAVRTVERRECDECVKISAQGVHLLLSG